MRRRRDSGNPKGLAAAGWFRARVVPALLSIVLAAAAEPVAARPGPMALAPVELVADGFQRLRGLVVDGGGNVYVADRAAGTVTRIAPDGSRSAVARRLARPIGLALAPDGRLLIAEERAGRVVRVEPSGARTPILSGVRRPRWLAVREDGALFVAARRLARGTDPEPEPDDDPAEPEVILHLTPAGRLGVLADGFRAVQGLAVNHDVLWAATRGRRGEPDAGGVIFQIPLRDDGSAGAPAPLGPRGAYKKPVGLARDRLGALWLTAEEATLAKPSTREKVLTFGKHRSRQVVAKLHPTGAVTGFAEDLEEPQGLGFDAEGHLYLADGRGGRVLRFRAPAPPTVTSPRVTNRSPFAVTGTTEAGARVDVFLGTAPAAAATVTAGADGSFHAPVRLPPNTATAVEVFATTHGGRGLTSPPAATAITHDGVAPSLTFHAPPALAHVRGLVPVEAQASDGGSEVASLALTLDGRPLGGTILTPAPPAPSATAAAAWDTTAVADGSHTLGATAADRAGNGTGATRVVTVDNTPPETTITAGPAEGAEVATAAVSLAFAGADNLTSAGNLVFSVRLDGGAWPAFGPATAATFAGLAEGPHTVEVRARDLAGNEDPTPAARRFTVRLGPAITAVTPDRGPIGTFVTIAGTNFEPAAARVTFNGRAAVVRTSTPTQLTTTVPIGATTGPLTVTTSRGSASHPFTVTLTGDFALTAAPATARVIAGDQTSLSLAAGGSGSFTSLVRLSLSGLPGGIAAAFSPSNLVAPGASVFATFTVAGTVAPGTYPVTVTGEAQVDGRTETRTATVTLEVLAPDTHAITGRVLTAEAVPKPIPGVTITLGTAFTLTDAGGNFVLQAPPPGPNMLLVDGRTASTPTAQYPPIEVQIDVGASGPSRVPFVLYLPVLDTAHPITLPLDAGGFTTAEVKATTPSIPGLEVTVPAGTRITGPDGNPVSQITITPVPVDRTPMPFPAGVTPPMLFTIQPGGAVPSQPLPITFPNVQHAPPGSTADLYFFDLAAGTWAVWGTGTVSADATRIASDPGVGLPRLAWHLYCDESCQAPSRAEAPPADNQPGITGGEPVDLFTGRFVVRKTDLVLPGRMPIRVERVYWSGLDRGGLFGMGWNLAGYDLRLAARGTSLALIQADQSQLLFVPDGSGRWVNRSAPFMQGAVITPLPGDFTFQLRLRNGTVKRFERIVGFANVAGLTQIADRNGNAVTVTREGSSPASFGRITRITEAAGRSFTLVYDAANRVVAVADPIGRRLQYTYDAQGRLETVTDPAGGITRYDYDAQHRIVAITDPRNITFITNEYDGEGRVARQTQADGAVWAFAYEPAGKAVRQTIVTDPQGNRTTYRFSALGFPLSVTDALGRTATFEYSPGGNLLTAATDTLGRRTRYTYDSRGNLTSATDPSGQTTTVTYDPDFNAVTAVTGPLGHVVRFERDGRGNVTGVVDATGARTVVVNDVFGQPVSVTDPLGHITTYEYDASGNPVAITDPLGNATRLAYDGVSRLVARTDGRGRTITFGYDALNRLVEIGAPAGGRTRLTYDGNGNVVTITDPRGQTTVHTHDSMDRLRTRTHPLGATERYEYDRAGDLVRYTDRNGRTVTHRYDALRRRIATTYGDGATVQLAYDAAGRAVEIGDSASGAVGYTYDVDDRPLTRTSALGTVAYAYDGLDRRTRLSLPGAAPIGYAYDANSRLIRVERGRQTVDLQYDAAGRRTGLTLPNGVSIDYRYDAASRLIGLTYRSPTGELGTLAYAYDPAGNLTRVGGSLARSGLPVPVGSAAYDAENRQLSFGEASLAYDAEGNPVMIADPAGVTVLEWDGRNRLVRLTGPAIRASFLYDAVGRRIAKTVGDATTHFLYDGPDVAQEVADGVATAYLRLPFVDAPVARGDSEYYLTDRLGSVLALTDATGRLTTHYVYEPFGSAAAEGAPSANPLQFTGREHDTTGLVYVRARYYAPALHRFLGQDLLPGPGANRYVYAGNNPLNALDPFGLETIIINGGLPSFGPGGVSAGRNPRNAGLDRMVGRLERINEEVVAFLNSGQTPQAFEQACRLKKRKRPVFLIGHSLGGRAALEVARRLLEDCGLAPDHVFTIDPFEAPDVMAPPGVPVTNFYQRRDWYFQGPEVAGARANVFVPGAFHLNITDHDLVRRTIEQTIRESRGLGESLGGRY